MKNIRKIETESNDFTYSGSSIMSIMMLEKTIIKTSDKTNAQPVELDGIYDQ